MGNRELFGQRSRSFGTLMFRSDPAEGILLLAPSFLLMTSSALENVIWDFHGTRWGMGWRDMGDEAEAYRFRVEFREITRARAPPAQGEFSAGAGQRLSISNPMMADNLGPLIPAWASCPYSSSQRNESQQKLYPAWKDRSCDREYTMGSPLVILVSWCRALGHPENAGQNRISRVDGHQLLIQSSGTRTLLPRSPVS